MFCFFSSSSEKNFDLIFFGLFVFFFLTSTRVLIFYSLLLVKKRGEKKAKILSRSFFLEFEEKEAKWPDNGGSTGG